jgi:hypothetical protein
MTPELRGYITGLVNQFTQAAIMRLVWTMQPRVLWPLLGIAVVGMGVWVSMG